MAKQEVSFLLLGMTVLVLAMGCESRVIPTSLLDYGESPVNLKVEDMASTGSLRRERRVQPEYYSEDLHTAPAERQPEVRKDHKKSVNKKSGKSNEGGFYKSYDDDLDGEKGYLKKSFSNDQNGYKSLDTFHKKLGDKYGFEKHQSFGHANDRKEHKPKTVESHHKSKQHHVKDHEGAGTDGVETHYSEYDGESDGYGYSDGDGDGDASGYGYGESYTYDDGGSGSQETYSAEESDGSYY